MAERDTAVEAAELASGEGEGFESAPEVAAVSDECMTTSSMAVDGPDYDFLAVLAMPDSQEVEAIIVDQIDPVSFVIAVPSNALLQTAELRSKLDLAGPLISAASFSISVRDEVETAAARVPARTCPVTLLQASSAFANSCRAAVEGFFLPQRFSAD